MPTCGSDCLQQRDKDDLFLALLFLLALIILALTVK
jgi:hypothetical protein